MGNRRLGLWVTASCLTLIAALSSASAAGASTTYYFHGTPTDNLNRVAVLGGQAQPTATFNTSAPTATDPIGSTQTSTAVGNKDQSANALSVYWYGPFSGSVSGGLYLDWYWSTRNAEAVLLGSRVYVTVWADPNPLIATTNKPIAQATADLNVGLTPTLNHTLVPLGTTANPCPCTVTKNLLIQVTPFFIDTGQDTAAHYDSTAVPSSFHFGALPVPSTPATAVAGAGQAFASYGSPPGFQTRDLATRPNSGEPSIGADWKTGKIMYMAGTQVSRVGFNTSTSPPTAKWTDVTPPEIATASEDSILYTDSLWGGLNRTWVEDFLVFPGCNANMALTDNDGGTAGFGTDWSPEQCPYAVGPDHPSIGAGPYAGSPPATSTYSRIVYYCSQNIVQLAGAQCTHSENGGLTWDPPTHIFGAGTPCGAIHGHIRVSPDGTVYVPQNNCAGGQGMAVSRDDGSTFTYSVVPDSTPRPSNTGTDPSVAADAGNNVYFGYEAGNGHPMIAVSRDHGKTWGPSTDAGAPFGIHVSVFPEVIGGDSGRAAFAFLGTTTPETSTVTDQAPDFKGVWYLYISFTYDGGATWHTVNATPNDPVQRGCVWNGGGGNACRNLLDFNDITIDKHGRVYVAYTDGCTKDPSGAYDCETNPAINASGCDTSGVGAGVFSENASEYSTKTCTYGRQSSLVRQVCGKGLIAAFDPGFFEGPTCRRHRRSA